MLNTISIKSPVFLVLACFLFLFPRVSHAAEFYVSPSGSSENTGSKTNPWSFQHALNQPETIQPGDTIWLRGGTYAGGLRSELVGTESQPITIRSYPGETARIDGAGKEAVQNNVLEIYGDWTIWRDLEILNSNPQRLTDISGSSDPKTTGGIRIGTGGDTQDSTVNHKLINNIIHNNGSSGIASWWSDQSDEVKGEIYGNIIFDNGRYSTADEVHGHGLYIQNKNGIKVVEDNIFINNFDHQLQQYGSGDSYLENIQYQGNVFAGTITLIGGGAPVKTTSFTNNYLYYTRFILGWTVGNESGFQFRNNYLGEGGIFLKQSWPDILFQDNTVVERILTGNGGRTEHRVLFWDIPGGDNSLNAIKPYSSATSWNNNNYYSANGTQFKPFNISSDGSTESYTYTQWRETTEFDSTSNHYDHTPEENKVFVEPNRYENDRGHIIIYNWEKKNAVEVDVSSIIENGTRYELFHAGDYFAGPIKTGIINGGQIDIPMSGLSTSEPYNKPDAYSYKTYEDGLFGAFLLKKASSTCMNAYTDVDSSNIFASHINNLTCDGIISGYPDKTFRPTLAVTRGEMAKFIRKSYGIDQDTSCDSFPDVPASYTFYTDITSLKCAGIVSGYTDGTFRPDIHVSRGEAMKFLMEGLRYRKNDPNFQLYTQSDTVFTDVTPTHTFYEPIMAGYTLGIVSGFSSDTFRPQENTLREQMAKIVDIARQK